MTRHLVPVSIYLSLLLSCNSPKEYKSFDEYPSYEGDDLELFYSPTKSVFTLWAPTAEEVRLNLYASGEGGEPVRRLPMKSSDKGTWRISVSEDLKGSFYTFQIRIGDKWLDETPGIWAKAVGVNGNRAAVIDWAATDPEGGEADKSPELKSFSDIIIYEMHHRDFSIAANSGVTHKGKFLALAEEGTKGPGGVATGVDHLKELGVTHVHILPSYDYGSVDETRLQDNVYNWGYDPKNYNAPEGSYSTDPYNPEARIREFKEMVRGLHRNGIRVIMDVVYNHTFVGDGSNFSLTVPGYFYRHKPDGSYSDASGCGNETASERAMVRRYIVESVKYWAEEYHVDGFRFDLTKGFTQNGNKDTDVSGYDESRISILRDYYNAIQSVSPEAVMICEHWTDWAEENVLALAGIQCWRKGSNTHDEGYYQSGMGYSERSSFSNLIQSGGNSIHFGGWVGFMESHDEERVAYKAQVYGNEKIKTDLTTRMNQLAANAAFCFTVPGPKMIWQFGELGYDETLGEEDEKTAKKPLHWEYYDEPARKSLYDVYAKLLDLRKTHANLFGQNATFSWKVETADWTGNTPRTISLKYNDKELVVVGNFGDDTTNYSLDSNIKYNYMTGDEVSGNITVEPHNFFLGTSFRPE